jgi:hypothetical protein
MKKHEIEDKVIIDMLCLLDSEKKRLDKSFVSKARRDIVNLVRSRK